MSIKTINMKKTLYKYYQDHCIQEAAILRELRLKTASLPMGHMQSSPEQAQLMQLIVQLMNAKKALDIGTFTGYSALSIALAMPADANIISCDVDAESTQIAQTFWRRAGVTEKIDLMLQPALHTLDELLANGEENSFDYILIDADKANYPQYYEKALKLIRVGGLIAIDNVLWNGKVADNTVTDASTETIRQLNQMIHQDERVMMSVVPIGDGVTLAMKK